MLFLFSSLNSDGNMKQNEPTRISPSNVSPAFPDRPKKHATLTCFLPRRGGIRPSLAASFRGRVVAGVYTALLRGSSTAATAATAGIVPPTHSVGASVAIGEL